MLWMSTGPASLAARIDHRSREADLQFSSSTGVPDEMGPAAFSPAEPSGIATTKFSAPDSRLSELR